MTADNTDLGTTIILSVHTLRVHSLLSSTLKIANTLLKVEQKGFCLTILFHSIWKSVGKWGLQTVMFCVTQVIDYWLEDVQ